MNNKSISLDKWDCKVISLFKNWDVSPENPLTINRLKEIWAERNGLDVEDVEILYITEHFLCLAWDLNLFDNDYKFREFIFDLDPKNNYKYVCSVNGYLTEETTDFQLILLSRLDSLFSLALADDLPGYREWLDKEKK